LSQSPTICNAYAYADEYIFTFASGFAATDCNADELYNIPLLAKGDASANVVAASAESTGVDLLDSGPRCMHLPRQYCAQQQLSQQCCHSNPVLLIGFAGRGMNSTIDNLPPSLWPLKRNPARPRTLETRAPQCCQHVQNEILGPHEHITSASY
jgi:hypothetical protein